MATTQVNPTRMELTKLKRKLVTATRGHKLLKDKRDELMRQFLDLVKENKALREKVEKGIERANKNFVLARASMSEETLYTALLAPKQEVSIDVSEKNIMSVDIPVFNIKTRTPDKNDIYSYGFAFTSSDLDDAVLALSDILPDMLKLAEIEKSCQLMASEIEKMGGTILFHTNVEKVYCENNRVKQIICRDQKTGEVKGTDKTYDMFASPVKVKTEKMAEVPNYGTGFTPYFLSLGLFVGALLLSIVYPLRDTVGVPKQHNTHGAAGGHQSVRQRQCYSGGPGDLIRSADLQRHVSSGAGEIQRGQGRPCPNHKERA